MKSNDLKKPYDYIAYLAIGLTVIGMIVTITQINSIPFFRLCIIALGYLLVLYYTFIGYRIPHGNLLCYVIIGFGILLVLTNASVALTTLPVSNSADQLNSGVGAMFLNSLIMGLCILLSGYISGRLNKFEQNKYLFTLMLVMLIIRVFLSVGNKTVILGDFNEVILWFDISYAYFIRYSQH